jgi:6-pyruvoyltetrahydropterin/6-carboxytetrahydropterin synthase
MRFTSNKKINLGSTAFRQWRSTHSHCQFIHGYNITADITFECDKLDERNWVMDFGGLKDLKKTLEHTFDHKLVVAADDPQLELIKHLDEAGVAEVIVLECGVGCERFAEFVLKTADTYVDEATNGRVRVQSVQINEHDSNFATCYRNDKQEVTVQEFVTGATNSIDVKFEEASEQSDTTTTTTGNIANPANVGPGNKSNSMGNPFAGTSWG